MRLEEEIRMTRPFASEAVKAMVNLMYTGNQIQDRIVDALKPFGINDQHFNILRILRGSHPQPMCPGEIKEVLINKRGDLTRLLDKLERMGWVSRQTNPENRRMVDVEITAQGLKQVEIIMKAQRQATQSILLSLNEEEYQQLNDLLDRLRG